VGNGVRALAEGRAVLRLLAPLTMERGHADGLVDALTEVME
jgi:4-aminobutyrate aminotransferase-like enzyme